MNNETITAAGNEISKCSRCGDCCQRSPCFLAKSMPGYNGKCLALLNNGGKHDCGLYSNPEKYFSGMLDWEYKVISEGVESFMGIGTICEKNGAEALVRSLFGDLPKTVVDFLLFEKTCFPVGQTSTIRSQLVDALIEKNINYLKT